MESTIQRYDVEANFLALLAQPTRLKLLYLLREGERCVCEIQPVMREDQSVVSRHLIKLKEAGILTSRKAGVSVFYSIAEPRVFELLELTDSLIHAIALQRADVSASLL